MEAIELQEQLKSLVSYYDFVVTKTGYGMRDFHVVVKRKEDIVCSFYMRSRGDMVSEILRLLIETTVEETRIRLYVQTIKAEQKETTDKILDVLGIELPVND